MTPGLAAHALRLHSCEKYRRMRASYERGIARERAVDRTPQPCRHKRAAHEHGTYACYTLDRCRCVPCAVANADYEQGRLRQLAYGRQDLVDADPVREHVRALMASGVGLKRIEQLTGMHGGAICTLMYGKLREDGTRRDPARRVRRARAEQILAVRLGDVAPGARVDPTGTVRRLGGLLALGWSVQRVADEHGLDRQALDRALRGHRVVASTAAKVRAAYEAIGDRPAPETTQRERGSASRARRRAAEGGWPVPAMWDDDALDDPTAPVPTSVRVPRGGVDLDEWMHLVSSGAHPTEAARRLGVSVSGVERAAFRHGRHDVLAAVQGARSAERRAAA